MKKRTEKTVKQADPELTTSKKLDQIKTGAKIKRQTGGTEKKETIIGGKNGAKTVVHETEEKLSNIKITKKILFDYNSKLTSKSNSIKNLSNKLHKKEIELQDKRLLYFDKVISVIQENFMIFKQLMKLNPEINKFIQKNKEFIYGIKTRNKKEKKN